MRKSYTSLEKSSEVRAISDPQPLAVLYSEVSHREEPGFSNAALMQSILLKEQEVLPMQDSSKRMGRQVEMYWLCAGAVLL
ncbi:hypothetical protein HNI00_01730 [Thermoleptolyngbya oregonensis NK1-22]|jgi:hypothetical protein|uniref:Uncharacterized protein n=1 Tax=Thermoleptolyngbya oregonensis NK1-22 TaxID=2547457 RepID=A0AA97BKK1_9CYAN|nr:hypothetical protein [Thermoleptolyngbya oregonensis]WOB42027.1 hypothetical protein HNI00_01730 [Thermoleptolyngbya oregonensis NK1-22]